MNLQTVPVSPIPSITIFVRHRADCSRADDEFYRNCKCSKHLRWTYDGRQYRQAAKTRSRSTAEERRHEIEAKFRAADPNQPVEAVKLESQSSRTIESAIELFISSKRSQGLDGGVLKKYVRELGRLKDFIAKRSKFFSMRSGWMT
jgi:integrase/recombinase XerD